MSKQPEKRPRLAIVERDAWLEPAENEINERYNRYNAKLNSIEEQYGSISNFADAYKYMGIHYDNQRKGWVYREWAPAAYQLYFFGDFNNWQRYSNPMKKDAQTGIWEVFLPEGEYKDRFVHGSRVKTLVHGQNGWNERLPAYIRRVIQDENSPNFSGQAWLPGEFDWNDDDFDINSLNAHLIYECHVGMAQEKEKVGSYTEFADYVLPRIKKAGYNIIQVMAIAEHPYYGSFGYHVSNFFAPASRSGSPEDLKYMIKRAHQMGIGVIMDIVHSHTIKNINEGLNEFDGTVGQYFHAGDRGNHPSWDSKLFDYGKTEVMQYLLSNVKYWLEEFRFDGYRFDGVTSMMYFHHGYGVTFDNQDVFFKQGVEFDAVTYLQLANKLIHEVKPGAISIAEDVSGMPGLCRPLEEGGMGFDYRLSMGIPDYWIKTLKEEKDEYWSVHNMYKTMIDRKWDERAIGYAESHDQALVGDKTIAQRLFEKEIYHSMKKDIHNPIVDRGVAIHKMIRLFTISLGGQAYLNFMGNEFGHPEWIDFPRPGNNYSHYHARRQWSLSEDESLKYHWLGEFDKRMLQVIRENNILEADYPTEIYMDDWHKTAIYKRGDLYFIFNWHIDQSMDGYEFPVLDEGKFRIILNTDQPDVGGFMRVDDSMDYNTFEKDGKPHLRLYVPNRSAMVLKRFE